MIKGIPRHIGIVLLDVAGAIVVGETPSVEIKVDGDVWKAATNPASVSDAKGRSSFLLDASEVTGASLQIYFESTTGVPVLINIGLDDAASTQILATPANKLATGAAGEVTTDTASRDASKADVSNLPTKGAQTWTHDNGEVATVTITQT